MEEGVRGYGISLCGHIFWILSWSLSSFISIHRVNHSHFFSSLQNTLHSFFYHIANFFLKIFFYNAPSTGSLLTLLHSFLPRPPPQPLHIQSKPGTKRKTKQNKIPFRVGISIPPPSPLRRRCGNAEGAVLGWVYVGKEGLGVGGCMGGKPERKH